MPQLLKMPRGPSGWSGGFTNLREVQERPGGFSGGHITQVTFSTSLLIHNADAGNPTIFFRECKEPGELPGSSHSRKKIVGFPASLQCSATFRDKRTEVTSLSPDKGTTGQAQNLAKGWDGPGQPVLSHPAGQNKTEQKMTF